MSYGLMIVKPPVVADEKAAWDWVQELAERDPGGTGGADVPAVYHQLIDRLTARYPCPCDLPDDEVDDSVWSDGPVRNNAGAELVHLGLSWPSVEAVTPFVVETALALGLTVFDPQTAQIHRPAADHPPTAAAPATGRPWWRFWG